MEDDVMKRAAVELARYDEKDPFAKMSTGMEIWRAYVPEVERHLIVLNALTETANAIANRRKTIVIDVSESGGEM